MCARQTMQTKNQKMANRPAPQTTEICIPPRMQINSASSGFGDRIGVILCRAALARSLETVFQLHWQTQVEHTDFRVHFCDKWEYIKTHCMFPESVSVSTHNENLPSADYLFNSNIEAPAGYLPSNDGYDINPVTALHTYAPFLNRIISQNVFLKNYNYCAQQFSINPPKNSTKIKGDYLVLHLRYLDNDSVFSPDQLLKNFNLIDKIAGHFPEIPWLVLSDNYSLIRIYTEFLQLRDLKIIDNAGPAFDSIEGVLQDFDLLMGSKGIIVCDERGWSSFSHVASLSRKIPIISVSSKRMVSYSQAGGIPDYFFMAGQENEFANRIQDLTHNFKKSLIRNTTLINLPRRNDRRMSVVQQLLRYKVIPHDIYDAIDAAEFESIDHMLLSQGMGVLAKDKYPDWVQQTDYRCRAKTGCAISHFKVLRNIAEKSFGWYVVLEDDIEIQSYFWVLEQNLRNTIKLYPDCQMIMLTNRHGIAYPATGEAALYGLDAYAITPKGAKIIVDSISFSKGTFHPDYSPDNHVAYLCKEKAIDIRILEPNWVHNIDDRQTDSDIETSEADIDKHGSYTKPRKLGIHNLGASPRFENFSTRMNRMLLKPRWSSRYQNSENQTEAAIRIDNNNEVHLNQSARLIWNLCDGTLNIREICDLIFEVVNEELNIIEQQVDECIQLFASNGMLDRLD